MVRVEPGEPRSPPTGLLLPVVFVLASTACGGDAGPPIAQEPLVRDSAGIRIVENGPVDLDTVAWHLSEDPVWRIGWEEGDPELVRVRHGLILPDGRAVVGEAESRRIYVLSTEGEILREFGRHGQGPGEFAAITGLAHLGGDTLLVSGGMSGSFSAFQDGALVRDFRGPGGSSFVGATGRSLVSLVPRRAPSVPAGQWRQMWVVVMGPDGQEVDSVAAVDIQPGSDGRVDPFVPTGNVDVAGRHVVFARNDRPEVRWLTPEGRLHRIARWEQEPPPVTDGVWREYEAWRREYMAGAPPSMIEEDLAQARTAVEGRLPYFRHVQGADDGDAWLGAFTIDRGLPSRYRIVASDGRWVGTIDVPPGLRILAISDDRILAEELDALDVPSVVLYRIVKD